MIYGVVGDMPAPTFFGINENSGQIYVKSNLRTDTNMEYKVCGVWLLIMSKFNTFWAIVETAGCLFYCALIKW